MGKKDPRIDAYIGKAAEFSRPILKHLRKVVHTGCPAVEETMKWSMPFFMYKGMLCNMAAFKQHCSFGFWKGRLLFGKAAETDGMGHFGRITALSDLPSKKELVRYVKKAVELNDSGVKSPRRAVPRKKQKLVVPDSLQIALKKHPKALAAFEAFSYSHKKEYVEWVTEAKRDETRQRRLDTAIAWMTEGKPRHWQYANC